MAARSDYLEQRIRTASPAQLHLMLIEGALRLAGQADKAYEANDVDSATQPLLRAMDITSELLAGVRHSEEDINVKLAAIYHFCFTRLTMAYVNTDREKLGEAIRVLGIERDTWRLACEKIGADGEAEAPVSKPEAVQGPHRPAPLTGVEMPAEGGLSLEA